MIPPARYLAELGDHTPPIPAELMVRIYDGYERRKRAMGRLDFEDMLGLALRLFDEHPEAAEARPITVLRVHRGRVPGREPAAGGAARAVARPARRPLRRGRRLPDDLRVHRRLARASAGLHATVPARDGRPSRGELPLHAGGPRPRESSRVSAGRVPRRPSVRPSPRALPRSRVPNPNEEAEVSAVVEAVRRLHHEEAVPLEEIAVLYRINARSEPFEEAFAAAGDPVSGARRGVPAATRTARGPAAAEANERGRRAWSTPSRPSPTQLGYDPEASPDADEEVTRQSDLARMRSLASEFERAHPGERPRGVPGRAGPPVLHRARAAVA